MNSDMDMGKDTIQAPFPHVRERRYLYLCCLLYPKDNPISLNQIQPKSAHYLEKIIDVLSSTIIDLISKMR